MKGKTKFSAAEADKIRELLRLKARADAAEQKKIRGKIRQVGFYISDFTDAVDGFLSQDFDDLISRGTIVVEPAKA